MKFYALLLLGLAVAQAQVITPPPMAYYYEDVYDDEYHDLEIRQEVSSSVSLISPDPWTCVTENITQYFDVPTPTAAVVDALVNYGNVLLRPCVASAKDRLEQQACSVTETSLWCGFTKAASVPTSVLTAYASYASAAASFWKAKSSTVQVLSTACPENWNKFSLTQHAWFNMTVAHAKCYLAANN